MRTAQEREFLQGLYRDYPSKVRVSKNLQYGMFYAPLQQVLEGLFPYCSVNPINCYNSAVFDYDSDWMGIDFDRCPVPNVTVINPNNNHAHLFYLLENAVHKNPTSSGKALQFLADTVEKMTYWMGADFNFTGVLGKNAFSEVWKVAIPRLQRYTLAELSDYFEKIPSENVRRHIAESRVESRNCAVFEIVRAWAYKNYHFFKNCDYTAFFSAVRDKADRENNYFDSPLTDNEVKGIAKSIAKWVWNNIYQGEQFMAYSERNRQQALKVRQAKAEERKKAVWAMYFNCRPIDQPTQQEIADKLGIARSLVQLYIKEYKALNLSRSDESEQMTFSFG